MNVEKKNINLNESSIEKKTLNLNPLKDPIRKKYWKLKWKRQKRWTRAAIKYRRTLKFKRYKRILKNYVVIRKYNQLKEEKDMHKKELNFLWHSLFWNRYSWYPVLDYTKTRKYIDPKFWDKIEHKEEARIRELEEDGYLYDEDEDEDLFLLEEKLVTLMHEKKRLNIQQRLFIRKFERKCKWVTTYDKFYDNRRNPWTKYTWFHKYIYEYQRYILLRTNEKKYYLIFYWEKLNHLKIICTKIYWLALSTSIYAYVFFKYIGPWLVQQYKDFIAFVEYCIALFPFTVSNYKTFYIELPKYLEFSASEKLVLFEDYILEGFKYIDMKLNVIAFNLNIYESVVGRFTRAIIKNSYSSIDYFFKFYDLHKYGEIVFNCEIVTKILDIFL